ncbi:MAG TPA: S8 family serine peptidase [Trebonia sp.]|jgi:hypothetical protein|nr:S8 family serine peptidase [Trebonia sp.]
MLSLRTPVLAAALTGALAAVTALGAAPAALAASASPAYSVPSNAWSQFQSDVKGAGHLANGKDVIVAVLSSGVDTSAPGLAGRSGEGPDYAFAPRASLENSLGTLTGALIVGVPGVTPGVAPDAAILGIRVEADSDERGASAFGNANFGDNSINTGQPMLAKAVTYATDHGAAVIEIDPEVWSGDGLSTQLAAAVKTAIRLGVVIVAPEENAGPGPGGYLFPAGIPGVIGVSSVMLPGGKPYYSASGKLVSVRHSAQNNSVVITGPGDFSQSSDDDWGLYGVSAAAAYVAGTVALIKQLHPDMSPSLVEQALAASARDKPAGGYSQDVGFGVLDPYQAVLDADKLATETVTAAPGAGVVAAGAHFGGGAPHGAINALPPEGRVVYAYWAAIGAGALLVVLAIVLAALFAVWARRRRRLA